jgi:predicted transcriptional regulator YdeE
MSVALTNFQTITLKPVTVIGKEIICKVNPQNGNPIPKFWDKCFSDGTIERLNALPNLAYPAVNVGWIGNWNQKTGEFSYVVGVLSNPTDSVPAEFEAIPMEETKFAVGTIKGTQPEVFLEGYELTKKAIEDNDLKLVEGYCCELEWYDERFCQNEEFRVIDIYLPVK